MIEIQFPKRTQFETVQTIKRQGFPWVALSAARTPDGALVVEYVQPYELVGLIVAAQWTRAGRT